MLWARVGPWPGNWILHEAAKGSQVRMKILRASVKAKCSQNKQTAVQKPRSHSSASAATVSNAAPSSPLVFLVTFGILAYLVSKQQQQLTFT